MGFNRTPHYADGLMLVGDAGGAVNPFNGEGIAYAMESAAMAAEATLQALGRPDGPSREAALHGYVAAMRDHLGSYYRLGGVFSSLIGHPSVMRTATRLRAAPQTPDVPGAQAARRSLRQPRRRLGRPRGPRSEPGGAQCLNLSVPSPARPEGGE